MFDNKNKNFNNHNYNHLDEEEISFSEDAELLAEYEMFAESSNFNNNVAMNTQNMGINDPFFNGGF
jgi:hypothetical protein